MKVLYYDCFSGISGDMNLAAMIDLGVDPRFLISELNKLGLKEFELVADRSQKMGIAGTQVRVHVHPQHKKHDHRHLSDIRSIIGQSSLDEEVKKLSMEIFMKIAEAEARVHDQDVETIHFHEVGAVDSIVDIVGAAICYRSLGVDKVMASTVELGGGFVDCEHGRLPVPAPATTEILKDIPVSMGRVPAETTTPTGAAILATLVNEFNDKPSMKILKTGYGIGHHDLPIPNVLRVILAEDMAHQTDNTVSTGVFMVECNIDDMNPEIYEYMVEKLLAAGADDVFLTPVIMKKGRPATMISVLTRSQTMENVTELLLTETTTLGLRKYPVEKTMLERVTVEVDTRFGKVPVKIALYRGKQIRMKPEYEVCRKLAEEHHVRISDIYDEVRRQADKQEP